MLSLLFGVVLLFHARYLAVVLITTLLAYVADYMVMPHCACTCACACTRVC